MNTMLRLTLLIMSLGFLSTAAQSIEFEKVPKAAELESIYFNTKNDWLLVIFRDGSGKLSGGPLKSDSAEIPKSTFDFQAIYSALVPLLNEKSSKKDVATVGLEKKGALSATALQLQQEAALTPLLLQAERAGVPFNAERFKSLLQDRPLSK